MFYIVDCGGFKQIISTDKPNTLKRLKDNFKDATIEGDEYGRPKIYSGADISKMFGGKSTKNVNVNNIIENSVKTVKRKS